MPRFEVRPTAEWLVGQDSDAKEHQFGRFFSGLGPALGIETTVFNETIHRVGDVDEASNKPNAAPFLVEMDIAKLRPDQIVQIGALADHDGFVLVPVLEDQ